MKKTGYLGGTITVTGAAVSGASIKIVSGTTVVAEGTATANSSVFEKVAAGTYVVVITKDGYDKVEKTVVVADNKTTEVAVDLVKTVVKDVKITNVTKVDTDKVTVEFEKLEKDIIGVTISIVDNNGNTVEVKARELVKNDTSASFYFTRTFTSTDQIKGVWYVDGVAYDVTVVNAIDAVFNASRGNQVDLLKALNTLDLTDVNEDNIKLYYDEAVKFADTMTVSELTVAKIQKMISDVNATAVTDADKKVAVKAVKDAKTQVALLNALQKYTVFERINPDWITDYETQINLLTLDEDATDISGEVKKIQDAVNGVNATKISSDKTAYAAGGADALNADKIAEFKTVVQKYHLPDDASTTTKATLLADLEKQVAIAKVVTADTPAQLSVAITALKALDSAYELDMENYVDDNRVAYVSLLAGKGTIDTDLNGIPHADVNKDTITELNDLFKAVNNVIAIRPIKELKTAAIASTSKTATENFYKKLSAVAGIKNLVKENAGYYANAATADATYGSSQTNSYTAAITNLADLDVADGASVDVLKAQIQFVVDAANANAIAVAGTASDADKTYAALVNFGNDLKDLTSLNKSYYITKLNSVTFDWDTQSAGKPSEALAPTSSDVSILNTEALQKTYIGAVEAKSKTNIAAIQTAVDGANIAAVQGAGSAEEILAKLQLIGQLKNVKPENAKAYFASKAVDASGEIGYSSLTTITDLQTAIDAVNSKQNQVNYVKALNTAKTAEEVCDALTNIAVDYVGNGQDAGTSSDVDSDNVNGYAAFIDLKYADKLIVAKLFMDDDNFGVGKLATTVRSESFGKYTEAGATLAVDAAIENDLEQIVDAMNTIVGFVNNEFATSTTTQGAPTNTSVKTALDELAKTGYKKFDDLTASQKLKVAEAFIASYPTNDKGEYIYSSYKSLTAVETAVDAAIASVVK